VVSEEQIMVIAENEPEYADYVDGDQ